MKKLTGVILCGGESKRMGRDKGLIEQDGKHWAVLMLDKLKNAGLPVILSINTSQQSAYEKLFPETPLIVDKLHLHGPLNGLLTIHETFPELDILLLATDMIDMDDDSLRELIKVYEQEPGFDFYAYQQNGFAQSFCSIFTSKGLKSIFDKFVQKEIKKFSLHDRFNEGNTKYIPLRNEQAFNNYNQI